MEIIHPLVGIGVLCIVIAYSLFVYNRIIKITNSINEAWANLVTGLKKRHDVMPSLITIVKESKDFENLIQQSQAALRTQDISAAGNVERMLQQKISVLIEAYPELKANKAFQDIFYDVTAIEDEIQGSRLLFNRSVAMYRRQLELFPANIFGSVFGFSTISFFELDPRS